MRIGDKITVKSAIINDTLFASVGAAKPRSNKGKTPSNTFTGTVVYINRKNRYFTVRFDFAKGSFTESFKFADRSR